MRTKNFQLKKCFLTISVQNVQAYRIDEKKTMVCVYYRKKRNILNRTKSAKNKTSRNNLTVQWIKSFITLALDHTAIFGYRMSTDW